MADKKPQARRGLGVRTPADYLERLDGIRQVGGSRMLEHTLGSTSALARRAAWPMINANIRLQNSNLPNLVKQTIGGSSDAMITAAFRLSEWADKTAGKYLSRHMEDLDRLDSGLLKSIARNGYLSGVPEVRNHVTKNMVTGVISSVDGVGRISMTNNYDGGMAAFDTPKTRSAFGTNKWVRALILCHEAAHVEFNRIETPFNPSPGSLIPDDQAQEIAAVRAINQWGIHEINTGGIASKFARSALNECHSDALSAMVILKESNLDPEALRAVADMARLRETHRTFNLENGRRDEHDGGGLAMRRVLEIKDQLANMTPEQVRDKATRIASDAYLAMAVAAGEEQSKFFLTGLCPDTTLDTGRIVVDMSDKTVINLPPSLTKHPAYPLLAYDTAWYKERHLEKVGSLTRSIGAWGEDLSVMRKEQASLNIIASERPLVMHRGDIEFPDSTPEPKGMSQDVFQGRLAIARGFVKEWDQARSVTLSATNRFWNDTFGKSEELTQTPGIGQPQPNAIKPR